MVTDQEVPKFEEEDDRVIVEEEQRFELFQFEEASQYNEFLSPSGYQGG